MVYSVSDGTETVVYSKYLWLPAHNFTEDQTHLHSSMNGRGTHKPSALARETVRETRVGLL